MIYSKEQIYDLIVTIDRGTCFGQYPVLDVINSIYCLNKNKLVGRITYFDPSVKKEIVMGGDEYTAEQFVVKYLDSYFNDQMWIYFEDIKCIFDDYKDAKKVLMLL